MYKSFYGLKGSPFSLLPDADFMYLSRRHRRAISMLDYGIASKAGFVVISGEVGAGKTTIIRQFLKNAGTSVTVGVITNTSVGAGCLLRWIAMAFELNDKGQDDVTLYTQFVDFLLTQFAKGRRTILIVDEAQNFSVGLLEELRMLSNVNNEKDQLLQMILVGQPELLATLKRPELRQFVQRITVHCHLEGLQSRETAEYIRHRLSVVGGAPTLFTNAACAAVHYFTGGVPRLINLLCDQALVYGFAEDVRQITHGTILDVVNDRGAAGLSAFRAVPPDWTAAQLLEELAQDAADGLTPESHDRTAETAPPPQCSAPAVQETPKPAETTAAPATMPGPPLTAEPARAPDPAPIPSPAPDQLIQAQARGVAETLVIPYQTPPAANTPLTDPAAMLRAVALPVRHLRKDRNKQRH